MAAIYTPGLARVMVTVKYGAMMVLRGLKSVAMLSATAGLVRGVTLLMLCCGMALTYFQAPTTPQGQAGYIHGTVQRGILSAETILIKAGVSTAIVPYRSCNPMAIIYMLE